MNNIIIDIIFKNGAKEKINCSDYEVKNGCLAIIIRFSKTRVFPLDTIKEFDIY